MFNLLNTFNLSGHGHADSNMCEMDFGIKLCYDFFPVEVSLLVEKRCSPVFCDLVQQTPSHEITILFGSFSPSCSVVQTFRGLPEWGSLRMPKLVPTRERLEGCCMDHSDNRQSNSDHCVQQIGSIICQHVTLKKRSKTGHYKVICVPASIVSLLASLVLGAGRPCNMEQHSFSPSVVLLSKASDTVTFVPRVASSFGTFGTVVGIVKSFRSTAVPHDKWCGRKWTYMVPPPEPTDCHSWMPFTVLCHYFLALKWVLL